MRINVGYFYFIKDSFFDVIDDAELMKNKENGIKRPCYYCFKDKKNKTITKRNYRKGRINIKT